MDDALIETLRDAQRFGFFGARPVEEAAAHSTGFVAAIGALEEGSRIIDLGSGGGLPGLVLAEAYPTAVVTLVDRREKRTDFLRRAVRRLGWDHVEVVTADVRELVRAVADERTEPFDVVTARGFGPPASTLQVAADLITSTGRIVISEPPTDDRWDSALLERLGLVRLRAGPVSVFRRA